MKKLFGIALLLTLSCPALEGDDLARTAVYLDGTLKVTPASSSRDRSKQRDDVREAPADYGPVSGRVARVQVGKAGKRLAETLARTVP